MSLSPTEPKNFWHTMIPAQHHTYVVRKNGQAKSGYTMEPIICWAPDSENAYRMPYPITIHGLTRVQRGAILFPCGMVSDPNQIHSFSSIDEWLAADTTVDDEADSTPRTRASKRTEVEDDDAGLIPDTAPDVDIEWTTGSFKTNSFYQYDDGSTTFVFAVEGGLNVPKQKGNVTKIKRDEFMALKKTSNVRDYEDLLEGGAAEEDDDDGSDLI